MAEINSFKFSAFMTLCVWGVCILDPTRCCKDTLSFLIAHHCLHHVWLGVAQCFGCEEHVHHTVVANHFQDHGACTKCTASSTAISAPKETKTHTETNICKQKVWYRSSNELGLVPIIQWIEGTQWNVRNWLSTDQACCWKKDNWKTLKMKIWVIFKAQAQWCFTSSLTSS